MANTPLPHPGEISPEFLALQAAVAGEYSLVRELGRGGMGVVFLAREVALDRLVAIKLLPPVLATDGTLRERFLREAKTAAQLSHPHIVSIHAVATRGELVFFVMEYVDGGTLGDRLRREGALPRDQALRIVQETAWGLAHAHARGVVHRDVKPDNILLEAGSDRALVTDFGIARAGETTDPALGAGTMHYMSPEQAHGDADARTDIYALGITAWHALAGRRPFEGQGGAALLAMQSRSEAPPIRSVVPTIPPPIADAIDRAVRLDPAARWPTMEEFARALGDARALAPQLPVPLRRFARHATEHGRQLGPVLGVTAAATFSALFTNAFLDNFLGIESAIFIFAGVISGSVAALLTGVHLREIRQLARRGYGRPAALRAVGTVDAEEVQEAAPVSGPPWSRRVQAVVSLGTAATIGGMMLMAKADWTPLNILGFLSALFTPAIMVARVAQLQGVKGSWWAKVLRGRVGGWFWRAATLGLGRIPEAPTSGEPTALALGGAVQAAYGALPPGEQQQLAGVPDVIARLEQIALERAHPRSTEAVMALETLRLDLMRLRAGQLAADGITEDLGALQRIGWYVDARGET
jgi:serine/threonine-protein kinase